MKWEESENKFGPVCTVKKSFIIFKQVIRNEKKVRVNLVQFAEWAKLSQTGVAGSSPFKMKLHVKQI